MYRYVNTFFLAVLLCMSGILYADGELNPNIPLESGGASPPGGGANYISSVRLQPDNIIVIGFTQSHGNPDACNPGGADVSKFALVDSMLGSHDEVYAMALTALITGKPIYGWLDSCQAWNGVDYPILTVLTIVS